MNYVVLVLGCVLEMKMIKTGGKLDSYIELDVSWCSRIVQDVFLSDARPTISYSVPQCRHVTFNFTFVLTKPGGRRGSVVCLWSHQPQASRCQKVRGPRTSYTSRSETAHKNGPRDEPSVDIGEIGKYEQRRRIWFVTQSCLRQRTWLVTETVTGRAGRV